ncbi:MAG: triosephosphate isomerase [Candidatus Pacebacteria bacterium]|nr:triosephosphate isomerase [Candidatus Paceibacterota bacterium]
MQKLILGNWKSNKTDQEVDSWLSEFIHKTKGLDFSKVEAVIAPPYPFLYKFKKIALKLGVQDISPFSAGSYTGAVAAHSLQDFGVDYVIIGHSERRRYFLETGDLISQKITQALINNLKPVVCVDESSFTELLSKVDQIDLQQCVIAYEPVSAIGTGNNASIEDVKNFKIKVEEKIGNVRYIYGGSVNETTVTEYLLVSDGVIIGGASLDAQQFVRVLRAAQGDYTEGS